MAIPKSRNTSIVKATIAKAPLNEEEAVLKARRARQRVSFDQRKNTLHDNTQWCREECQELWYSAGELNQMKEECYALARKIHQKEKDFQVRTRGLLSNFSCYRGYKNRFDIN